MGQLAREKIRELLVSNVDAFETTNDVPQRVVDYYKRHPDAQEHLIDDNSWRPIQPPEHAVLTRYRDFPQFISILENESLWFSRANEFDDPYEGRPSEKSLISKFSSGRAVLSEVDSLPGNLGERYRQKANNSPLATSLKEYDFLRQISYINCWRQGEDDSAIMWDAYSQRAYGVAIQTTVGKLNSAVAKGESDYGKIHRSLVDYLDYEKDPIPYMGGIGPFFSKRQIFADESEFRLLIQDISPKQDQSLDISTASSSVDVSLDTPIGKSVPVDLDTLIERVIVSPYSDEWFLSVVEGTVNQYCEEYNIDIKVEKSDISSPPPWASNR